MQSDSTAAFGISSRSGAGKLRRLGVKELWIQELVQARKLLTKRVGTDDILADVGTKYIDDGKKLVHLCFEDEEGLGAEGLERGVGGLARLYEHRAR